MQLSNQIEVTLNKGIKMLIDSDVWDLFKHKKWFAVNSHARGNFYVMRASYGKTETLHRLIMGVNDRNVFVDHINHNTLDNRKCNLRLCTRSENARNLNSHKDSISKYLGVTLHKNRNKWQTQIKINGKNTYIGVFEKEIDAAMAYDKVAKIHHKQYANLNFK